MTTLDGPLALLTQRTGLVRKMATARGMDLREFRKLYDARVKLMKLLHNGNGNSEALVKEIDDATEALHGAVLPNPEYAIWAEEADRLQARLVGGFSTEHQPPASRLRRVCAAIASVKAHFVVAIAIIVAMGLYVFFSPYQTCVREAASSYRTTNPAVLCARLLGGRR